MSLFQPPTIYPFFDNRILISWELEQPFNIPPLINITIMLQGNPPLTFDPPQSNVIKISEMNKNQIIINWVVKKPKIKTIIKLILSCETINEEQELIYSPS